MNKFDAASLHFEQQEGGALSLRIADGKCHAVIECVPLFPHSCPGRYVSVCERDDSGLKEIGIIPDLSVLDPQQRELIEADIRFRYFVPEITDILALSSKRGIDTWEVETDRGKKTFTVQDRSENVLLTDNGMVVVADVDGCRYKIREYRTLSRKSRLFLEKILL